MPVNHIDTANLTHTDPRRRLAAINDIALSTEAVRPRLQALAALLHDPLEPIAVDAAYAMASAGADAVPPLLNILRGDTEEEDLCACATARTCQAGHPVTAGPQRWGGSSSRVARSNGSPPWVLQANGMARDASVVGWCLVVPAGLVLGIYSQPYPRDDSPRTRSCGHVYVQGRRLWRMPAGAAMPRKIAATARATACCMAGPPAFLEGSVNRFPPRPNLDRRPAAEPATPVHRGNLRRPRGLAVSAALALIACLLAACSSQGVVTTPANSAAKGPRISVAMVTHGQGFDPFWALVRKGAEQAATDFNVDLRLQLPRHHRPERAGQADHRRGRAAARGDGGDDPRPGGAVRADQAGGHGSGLPGHRDERRPSTSSTSVGGLTYVGQDETAGRAGGGHARWPRPGSPTGCASSTRSRTPR